MNKLLNVVSFTAILTFVRMLMSFIVVKIISIYGGPSVLALVGQLQSFITAANGLVNSPSGAAVIRYTSKTADKGIESSSLWWKASVNWNLAIIIIIMIIGIPMAKDISVYIFGDNSKYWLIYAVILSLPLAVVGTFLNSIINGLEKYKLFVKVGIISVSITTLIMLVMIFFYGINGALIAASLQWGITGLIVLIFCLKQPWLRRKFFFGQATSLHLKGVGGFVIMAITSALTLPIAILIIRKIIANNFGWDAAGHWDAVWRISNLYLTVITIALSTYFLPKLSKIDNAKGILRELNHTIKLVLPIVILIAFIIYILRDLIIVVLFTNEFQAASDLFLIQLCGDVVKIASWIYAYPMISQANTKLYVYSEIIFSIFFVILAFNLISIFDLKGVNISYLISYSIYFVFFFLYTNFQARKELKCIELKS